VQEPTVYLKLGLILPAGFLICFTLALIFACRYTLTREKVTEYQKAMQQRPEQGSVSG
jgi:Na+/melibiose symporter-like transporter